MRAIHADALARLESDHIVMAGAVRMSFGSTYRLWSGIGDLSMSGEGTFTGCGAMALVAPLSSQVGGAAEGVELRLSGLDPTIAATIDAEDYHQKPVTIWRLVFDASGTALLGQAVFFRGRVDVVRIEEEIGGESAIVMQVEGGRRDMSRAGARMRSDADQRTLSGSSDGAFRHITTAGRRTLYWGKRPASPATLNGGSVRPALMPEAN